MLKTTTEQIFFADIVSNLGQMVWTKDIVTGEFLFLTSNFPEVFGVSQEALEADPFLIKKLIHPDDRHFIDLFSKALLSYGSEQIEYRIVTPQGKLKWIAERKNLKKNAQGEIIRVDAMLTEITEQKESELKLIDSEITFKSLFFRHPQPMWVYDLESLYFMAVNDAAIDFYGYTHDEFFRMTIKQIRPREEVPELLRKIQNNDFEENKPRIWRHLKKDGTQIFVRIVSTEIVFRGKRARLVLAQDITGEVNMRTESDSVHHYLEKFQEAVSSSSLLSLLDSDGNILFINQNLKDKMGLGEGSLAGEYFSRLFSNIYKTSHFQEIWNEVANGKTWNGDRKFFKQNGPHFWAHVSIVPIADTEGSNIQYVVVANDISVVKEAERKSSEIAIRLHNILEGVTDAIFVVDRKWLITNVNKECETLLKTKRNKLIGKNIWEVFPEEEGFKFYQFFRKAKKRRITVQFEEYFEPMDQWFDISLYPSKDGLAVCFRNVTERRRQDEEKKELFEQLIVQNRDLEEFTYIASHSLRAQSANVSMLCAAIDSHGMTPGNMEIFEKLYQSATNLTTVISDLTTILTVKNRSSILLEDVQFHNSFVNAVSRLPYSFSPFKKCIRMEAEPEFTLYSVRSYIETLLFQLLDNALRYRSIDREPEVFVQAGQKDGYYYITVTDNGRGMDQVRVQKQLFQLYKTFHPGTSGKGLGLYLCKVLVDELNGHISIASQPGRGTTVSVQLAIPQH